MGRVKLEIKKIENPTNRQVTYSKRRNGIMKKAHELSVLCDVDVALLLFSPSGKLTTFSSDENIERILERFANTPLHQRNKREHEDVELLNKIVHKLREDRGEAPRMSYAQLQLENQELKVAYEKMNVALEKMNGALEKVTQEKAFYEARARVIADMEYRSLEDLYMLRREMVAAVDGLDENIAQGEARRGHEMQQMTYPDIQQQQQQQRDIQHSSIQQQQQQQLDIQQQQQQQRDIQQQQQQRELAYAQASTSRPMFPVDPAAPNSEFGYLQQKVEDTQYGYGASPLLSTGMSYQGRHGDTIDTSGGDRYSHTFQQLTGGLGAFHQA